MCKEIDTLIDVWLVGNDRSHAVRRLEESPVLGVELDVLFAEDCPVSRVSPRAIPSGLGKLRPKAVDSLSSVWAIQTVAIWAIPNNRPFGVISL